MTDMFATRRVVAWLFSISLLIVPGTAVSFHFCDCQFSSWQVNAPAVPVPLFVCPQGDTDSFIDQGWWISLACFDDLGSPDVGIPASDFWLISENDGDIVLCMGTASANADSATNAAGMTTLSNTPLVAGGCADGMALVALGKVLLEPDCVTVKIEPIYVRSPDLDGSLLVDLVDLSIFASHFPPQLYEACCDFDINGVINLQDLAMFALHFGPPGHQCG